MPSPEELARAPSGNLYYSSRQACSQADDALRVRRIPYLADGTVDFDSLSALAARPQDGVDDSQSCNEDSQPTPTGSFLAATAQARKELLLQSHRKSDHQPNIMIPNSRKSLPAASVLRTAISPRFFPALSARGITPQNINKTRVADSPLFLRDREVATFALGGHSAGLPNTTASFFKQPPNITAATTSREHKGPTLQPPNITTAQHQGHATAENDEKIGA